MKFQICQPGFFADFTPSYDYWTKPGKIQDSSYPKFKIRHSLRTPIMIITATTKGGALQRFGIFAFEHFIFCSHGFLCLCLSLILNRFLSNWIKWKKELAGLTVSISQVTAIYIPLSLPLHRPDQRYYSSLDMFWQLRPDRYYLSEVWRWFRSIDFTLFLGFWCQLRCQLLFGCFASICFFRTWRVKATVC